MGMLEIAFGISFEVILDGFAIELVLVLETLGIDFLFILTQILVKFVSFLCTFSRYALWYGKNIPTKSHLTQNSGGRGCLFIFLPKKGCCLVIMIQKGLY